MCLSAAGVGGSQQAIGIVVSLAPQLIGDTVGSVRPTWKVVSKSVVIVRWHFLRSEGVPCLSALFSHASRNKGFGHTRIILGRTDHKPITKIGSSICSIAVGGHVVF